ncbi:MAG: glycosyltransferase [Bdellovibrionales bacterium]|nr:glycosyltransferase [Bdellovibrionales bacterium]
MSRKRGMMNVYHGPISIAGMAWNLASWQRANGIESDCVLEQECPLKNPHHICLTLERFGFLRRQLARFNFFLFALGKYDIFHFYYGLSLLPYNLDLPMLRLFGKKIIMTYCGSDIRLMYIEQDRNPYAAHVEGEGNSLKEDAGKKWKMFWHRLWVHKVFAARDARRWALEVFPESMVVSDIWINNSLDLGELVYQEPHVGHEVCVVHAPTSHHFKGTRFVRGAVETLKEEGIPFRYVEISDLPHDDLMRLLTEDADIVVDQLLFGGIGSLAMEAMSLGKVVLSYYTDELRTSVLKDCPVIPSTIDTVTDDLRALIKDFEQRRLLGIKGREFVEKHVDRENIGRQVIALYQSL